MCFNTGVGSILKMHSFNKHVLATYYVLGTVFGAGDNSKQTSYFDVAVFGMNMLKHFG